MCQWRWARGNKCRDKKRVLLKKVINLFFTNAIVIINIIIWFSIIKIIFLKKRPTSHMTSLSTNRSRRMKLNRALGSWVLWLGPCKSMKWWLIPIWWSRRKIYPPIPSTKLSWSTRPGVWWCLITNKWWAWYNDMISMPLHHIGII